MALVVEVVLLELFFITSLFMRSLGLQEAFFAIQDSCHGKVLPQDYCPITYPTTHRIKCASYCRAMDGCVSFLLDSGSGSCHLCTTTVGTDCNNTVSRADVSAYEQRCANGGQRVNGMCQCSPAYSGHNCEIRMTDCMDWIHNGHTSGTEMLWIHPVRSPEPFPVLCHTSWNRLLIMNRESTTLSFYRNWTEYAEGFGDVSGDHWLGLHKLHQLTHSRSYRLCVQFNLRNGSYYQQYYNEFLVDGEARQFAMTFLGTFPLNNRELGDCLSDVKGKPFSTYDADHDDDVSGSCAQRHHSGWWFGNCTLCNPTGLLIQPSDMLRTGDPEEVFWSRDLNQLVPERLFMSLTRL